MTSLREKLGLKEKLRFVRTHLSSPVLAPRDVERLIGLGNEKARQRRSDDLGYAFFGEQSDSSSRWKFSLADCVGLWLVEEFMDRGSSLAESASMAQAAYETVCAAIALEGDDPTVLVISRLKKRDPAESSRHNATAFSTSAALAEFIAKTRPDFSQVMYVRDWVARAPASLAFEIRSAAGEANK